MYSQYLSCCAFGQIYTKCLKYHVIANVGIAMVAGYTFLTKGRCLWLSIWMDGRTFPECTYGLVLLKIYQRYIF
jgi:hypothetical protein